MYDKFRKALSALRVCKENDNRVTFSYLEEDEYEILSQEQKASVELIICMKEYLIQLGYTVEQKKNNQPLSIRIALNEINFPIEDPDFFDLLPYLPSKIKPYGRDKYLVIDKGQVSYLSDSDLQNGDIIMGSNNLNISSAEMVIWLAKEKFIGF